MRVKSRPIHTKQVCCCGPLDAIPENNCSDRFFTSNLVYPEHVRPSFDQTKSIISNVPSVSSSGRPQSLPEAAGGQAAGGGEQPAEREAIHRQRAAAV